MTSQLRIKNLFKEAACTRCGECFHRCPELRLPLNLAQQEIKNLIEGKESQYVLAHCTTCFSCNLICPHDCKPYQLILQRWNELYKKRGAPPIYRFVCPTMENSIWQMLLAFMRPEETAWINKWTTQEPKGIILLIGSYVHLLPFVVGNSKLLDYFTPVDLLDHWECGAYLYQAGYLGVVKQIAEKCKQDFETWEVKTIVPLLDAVHWMLTDAFPHELNVHHDLNVMNFHEWLLNQVTDGEIRLQKHLGLKVTVHDNCYSKAGNNHYWNLPRELLQLTGCEIIEMKHNRASSLCCGFGAAASWADPKKIVFDIMAVAQRKFQEAEATGAEAMVSYCGGCLYILWTARELFGSKIEIYHLAEVIRMSMGEQLDYPTTHIRRAWDLIAIISYHMLMSMLGKPFWIEKIALTEEPSKNHRFLLAKALRLMLEVPPVRVVYRKVFQIMLPKLKPKRNIT